MSSSRRLLVRLIRLQETRMYSLPLLMGRSGRWTPCINATTRGCIRWHIEWLAITRLPKTCSRKRSCGCGDGPPPTLLKRGACVAGFLRSCAIMPLTTYASSELPLTSLSEDIIAETVAQVAGIAAQAIDNIAPDVIDFLHVIEFLVAEMHDGSGFQAAMIQ